MKNKMITLFRSDFRSSLYSIDPFDEILQALEIKENKWIDINHVDISIEYADGFTVGGELVERNCFK